MKRRMAAATVLCLMLGLGPVNAGEKGATMAGKASGTFEVKVKPLPGGEKAEGLTVGRLSLDKEFKGDLEGTGKGEMVTTETAVPGSAGYVAFEQVSGKLKGRSGTFTLLHQATMRRGGEFEMSIIVVPDSGTGQLVGLTGKMTIVITEGKHSYQLDYTLPDAP